MPSFRRLPRWETPAPKGVAGSYGPRVVAWAKHRLGVTLDGWQAYGLRNALRYDRQGDLIARIVLLSTGRQNGKSVIVRSLFGWMLDEGQHLEPFARWTTLLAAAHDAKQARIVYKGVAGDFDTNDELKAKSRVSVYRGITVGSIDFDIVTSAPGSARGWSAGGIAWDEMLTQVDWRMWEALAPTQNAQRSPLMILTSTAGHDESVVLRAFYDRLVRQASGDEKPDPSFYGAWWQSRDQDAGLDWRQIGQANPALGTGRLSKQAIRTAHAILPGDSWRREILNHWVKAELPGAFAPGVWSALRTSTPLAGIDPPYALGLDIAPGWERATIVVAAIRPDGRVAAEVWRDLRSDVGPLTADRVMAELDAFPHPVTSVLYDSVSPAGAELDRHAAEVWGPDYRSLKPAQVVTACMDVTSMILSGRIAVDDPLLDAQVGWMARRPIGSEGAFRFTRAGSGGPIDAVMALTFAVHGAVNVAPFPSIQ